MIRHLLLVILSCLHLKDALAFEPHFAVREFEEAYSDLGLNLIYQDLNCMIWFGTSEGLLQFTGNQFVQIPLTDSLPPQGVTALFEDRSGMMWIGTEYGNILKYTIHSGTQVWKIEEGLPRAKITGFIEDEKGQLWIGTYGEGLYVYSDGRLYNINEDDGLLGNDIYTIAIDGSGKIWAATDHGISICSYNGSKDLKSLTNSDGLPDQIVSCLIPDQDGNMWIGTYEGGLAFYNTNTQSISAIFDQGAPGHINRLILFEGIELWIGTQDNGLWRFSLETESFEPGRSLDLLRNIEIQDLLADVEGNIWVVSGINTIHTAYRPFEKLELPIGYVQAILSTAPDTLWVGTDNGLYLVHKNAEREWHHQRLDEAPFVSVASLDHDSYGNIWIGALDFGLCVYDPRLQKFLSLEEYQFLRNNPVISFFIDDNDIWLATLGMGVMHLEAEGDIMHGGNIEFVTNAQDADESHNFIFQIQPGDNDHVLLATDGAGLAYASGNRIKSMSGNEPAPKTIYAMTRDRSGHLWLVTPDNGLVEYNYTRHHPLGIEEGLRSTSISSVITTHNGEMLVTHNKGIDLLIPEERHFMYFDDEIGLKGAVPVLNAVYRDDSHSVWIGMENMIVKYTSLEETLSIHPRTWISHVLVNQEPIDIHGENRFPANHNFFAFDYVGLWYTSPSSVKYLYTLQGHDIDWKESNDHLAIYSNLKPGEYVFKVRASENNFFYDEPLAEYAFEIRKPFWQELWFVLLILAVLGGLFYLIIKSREARLRRIEVLNKEKIESQFMALKAQINPHFLFNSFNTLITIIDENTKNPDVPIEYVQKLADFYRSILQYREEEVISIPEEIQLVQNFYYLLQKRYGDNLVLDIHIDGPSGLVPPLVLQMLVENAVKHNVISRSNPLTIRIYKEDQKYLVVENNIQKKVSNVASTRFGLQNIVKRYQLISDKKVLIDESNGIFKVSLPIIQTEL